MLELPETATIARQIVENLAGRTVTAVFNATHLHKLTWFAGEAEEYPALITGRLIVRADGRGPFVDILFDDDIHLALSDGVVVRHCGPEAKVPERYQLLVTLDRGDFIVCTVAMYGGIQAFRGVMDNPYYRGALSKPSPLEAGFDGNRFEELFSATLKASPAASAKAFLATGQHIPGVGNGVLQDILLKARINPRRKIATLAPGEKHTLFKTLKETLGEMSFRGGRDTERDLYGNPGGYRTLLSRNTWQNPCPLCGGRITKEPYMGGAVYYCPHCQPL